MRLELTRSEVNEAISQWLTTNFGISEPVEVLKVADYFRPYAVETDPKLFIHPEGHK